MSSFRSIKRLLEVLQDEWESSVQPSPSALAKGKGVAGRSPPTSSVRFSTSPLTENHRRIRMRLSALLPIEEQLTKKLLPEANDKVQDVCVRAGSGWKGVLVSLSSTNPPAPAQKVPSRPGTSDARSRDDPTAVLAQCRDDIIALWEDPVVKGILKKHNVRLQDMPGL